MVKEINIYEDLRKGMYILESTHLSEDYLNEINSRIMNLQIMQQAPHSEKQELEKIITQDMPNYEEYYTQQYKEHPEFREGFINLAKSKPEFLKLLNKAVDQYNTFSKE